MSRSRDYVNGIPSEIAQRLIGKTSKSHYGVLEHHEPKKEKRKRKRKVTKNRITIEDIIHYEGNRP